MEPSPPAKNPKQVVRVADFADAMEALAPTALAESWDNVGLQVGSPQAPVERVWVALDPLETVIRAACNANVDLLICHHPLTLNGIKQVDFASHYGRILQMCACQNLSVISAHTNLDAAIGGLNDIWARKLNIRVKGPLQPREEAPRYKLVVFVPVEAETDFLTALNQVKGAGHIGNYDMCTFRTAGTGTFRPLDGSRPYSGTTGEFSQVEEVRIETVLESNAVAHVLAACQKAHPYETMAYDLYPLNSEKSGKGIGRLGHLQEKTCLADLAREIQSRMQLSQVRMIGDPHLDVEKVALCTGSGGSLLPAFFSSDAQAFLSGDLRYHDAREIEQRGLGGIDVGHFASEHIVVSFLTDYLEKWRRERHWQVTIDACDLEEDPFRLIW